jgi:glycerate 2-kinase
MISGTYRAGSQGVLDDALRPGSQFLPITPQQEVGMGHVVVALDSFKGSISAADASAAVAQGIRSTRSDVPVRCCPIADGGEGTLAALGSAGFSSVPVRATGPLGERVRSGYAYRRSVAVVELADAAGMHLLPAGGPDRRTAARASSLGAGQVLTAAVTNGHPTVVLALGGSACTDGGAGLLTALGARLLDAAGEELPPGGMALHRLHRVDLRRLHPRLAVSPRRSDHPVELVLASDVDNPLLGPLGAAATYGPQKGATPEQVLHLEAGLARWAEVLSEATGTDLADRAGAGAAGGVGFAALVLGAVLRPGIDLVLGLTGIASQLTDAELVVTGEGSLDSQTLHGKAPAGVAAAARAAGVPVIAVAGRVLLSRPELEAAGITGALALADLEPDPRRSMRNARELLVRLGKRIALTHLDRDRSPLLA